MEDPSPQSTTTSTAPESSPSHEEAVSIDKHLDAGVDAVRRHKPWRYYGAVVDKTSQKTTFRVYAPEATCVLLLRAGNGWGEREERLERGEDGTWTITIDEDLTGSEYKYRVQNHHDYLPHPGYDMWRLDPFTFDCVGEGRVWNAVVTDHLKFKWTHKHHTKGREPMSIYELHLGGFCPFGNYRDIATKIVQHCGWLGFTHVQIMPPFQTPLYESWGYLVSLPYCMYHRYGTLDDFKWLVNHLHEHDIGVIVDVPLGFTIKDWDTGIAMFDGTDVYHHHHLSLKGWNDQWNTRVYNHDSQYVRDYLIGILAYMHEECGVDGVRIDAVAAQVYQDYDRGLKSWRKNDWGSFTEEDWRLINGLGGDKHMGAYYLSEAVDLPALKFLRELHQRLLERYPSFFTIAEESRRVFPKLACPIEEGGLGFTYAQDLAEMHRMRRYLHKFTEHRKVEEIEGVLLSSRPEKMISPITTHDEAANGKLRIFSEMGNHLQLIGLAAFMYFRPGVPMVFMGDEFGEEGSFTVGSGDRPVGLDWSKTGPHAQMHQQMLIANFHDLNAILTKEPAFRRQDSSSLDRNGSHNQFKWISFVRWGSDEHSWTSGSELDHKDDLVFVRNENHGHVPANIYVPSEGEWRVIYNSIDERYIGKHDYNQHDPYWTAHSQGRFLYLWLAPFQNIALKRVTPTPTHKGDAHTHQLEDRSGECGPIATPPTVAEGLASGGRGAASTEMDYGRLSALSESDETVRTEG